jgi:hypothetical protein
MFTNIAFVETGTFAVFAGNSVMGYADGIGSSANFDMPRGIAITSSGVIYVADGSNHVIRSISTAGIFLKCVCYLPG